MSHDNHTAEVEIASALKKISVLGPTTFESCSFLQEIQNFIKVLKPITFGGCSFLHKIQILLKFWYQKSLEAIAQLKTRELTQFLRS